MWGWFLLEDTISTWADQAGGELVAEVEDRAVEVAQQILAYAKENAPWEDRTGAARAGLDVAVDSAGAEVVIQLYHTVDYGLWLEVIQNGRFAIIMPTLELFAPQMLSSGYTVIDGGE